MTVAIDSRGVDFSDARPTTAQLQADGDTFVCRYSAPAREIAKILTPPEAKGYWAAGIATVLQFEDGISNWIGGATQGKIDGTVAAFDADVLGWPTSRPIYATADQHVPPEQYPVLAAYLTAFGQATGRGPAGTGLYAERLAIDAMIQQGVTAWGWQSASTFNIPGNETTTQLGHICQQLGGTSIPGTDRDIALKADIGAWNGEPVACSITVTLPVLSLGATGRQVDKLQGLMLGQGLQGLTQSGTFDAATQSALEAWQRFFHLPVTGQADQATWASLVGLPAS